MQRFGYSRKSTILDFTIACAVKAGRHPLVILLGGTSGCGKSTLASLLASRLGVTTVLSTDNVRHIMRNYVDAKANPVLFASTYNAGEALTDADHLSPQDRVRAPGERMDSCHCCSRGGSGCCCFCGCCCRRRRRCVA